MNDWQPEPKPEWDLVPREKRLKDVERPRLRHLERVRRVVDLVRQHDYVVILGPAHSDKTALMFDVHDALADGAQYTPVYINLWRVRTDDEASFFASLTQTIVRSEHVSSTRPEGRVRTERVADAASFRQFLDRLVSEHDRHLVLLLDHLHSLPHDLTHRLLQLLRSAYMERRPDATHLVDVVVAGSAVLAELSHDPTSPFNMARPVFHGPLSDAASQALVEADLLSYGVPYSPNAVLRLLHWARGDSYLLLHLVALCQEMVTGYERRRITQSVIDQAVRAFMATARQEAPVRSTIEAIEDDPDTMLDIVALLNQETLPRNRTHQQIWRTGVDRLQLSGAVYLEGDEYRIKNELYRQALRQHFGQSRVAHVLRMNGRWQEAISYLSATQAPDTASRSLEHNGGWADLLEAIIQSIYAANRDQDAYHALLEGIRLGFNLNDVRIYRAYAGRGELRLVEPTAEVPGAPAVIDLNDESLAEVRTFRGGESSVRGEVGSRRLLAPLVPEQRAIGMVVIEHYSKEEEPHSNPEYHGELLRFLRYASTALENVVLRSAIQEIGRAVLNASAVNSNLEQVLQTVLNAAGGDAALLYLLNSEQTRLVRTVHTGDVAAVRNAGEAAIELVWAAHPAVMALDGGGFTPARQTTPPELCAYLPLSAGGVRLGVLALYFAAVRQGGFSQEDRKTLRTFADQVAIAVHNLQLLRRTNEALQEQVRQLEAMRRRDEQVRDQELLDVANAMVHRFNNAAGDVPYHLSRIRAAVSSDDAAALDALEHVEIRFRHVLDLATPLEEITDMAGIVLRPLELAGLVQEAVANLLPKDDRVLVDLSLEHDIFIEANRKLLHDALLSILDNGCEAMPSGGVLAVRVSDEGDGRAAVRIRDYGQGIAEAYKAHMFEPGFSTKPSLGPNHSRGRGMFTCRAIVRKHGGDMLIESQQGVGTEVTILLPLLSRSL